MVRHTLLWMLVVGLAGCEVAEAILESVAENSAPPPSLTIPADQSAGDVAPRIQAASASGTGQLTVCSFNIQFLGNSRERDDRALAGVVAPYDIVVVQELVSPPFAGQFPDGTSLKPDAESAEFFAEMSSLGFSYVMSEEDTGTSDKIHRNGSSTEWWVVFYKPGRVSVASDLPSGYLAADRSNHEHFERVPYAFGFRTPDESLDFVLISVHLKPGAGPRERARRKEELAAIAAWIDAHDQAEHDFIILGDMNIENASELTSATPPGFASLNDECRPTNTNIRGPKPYDHVMFNSTFTGEIDLAYDMTVVDLVNEMRDDWTLAAPYPGEPYNHNEFRKFYSDHHPVVFRLNIPTQDDDAPVRVAGGS
jgi:endonuclease/exonuclease/phosphatase family metal-dependent hydrolase